MLNISIPMPWFGILIAKAKGHIFSGHNLKLQIQSQKGFEK